MRMKIASLSILLLAASALPLQAAQAQTKIGVVNVARLLQESPQAQAASQALENEFAARRRELEAQQKDLKAREDKLQKDGAVMAAAERSNAEKTLRDGQREFARKQNEFLEDLNVRRNEVLGFIKQGLRDFSMSRTSITWGVPLPWDPDHVAYVWFDALFNYCTAIGYGDDRARFDRYWPVDYHIVGKDIVRFHAVYWPAMLMAAGEAPPKCVFAHGFLLVGGEKMSKTGLNQIAPADLVETFGSDGFRYHFLTDQRFGPDGDFSFEAMVARYNADLANNFGNLASRVLNMAVNYCDGVAPEARAEGPLVAATARAFEENTRRLGRLDYAGAYGAVWELIGAANSFIEDSEPWKLYKAGDDDAVAGVLGDCLEALRIVALLASPIVPAACRELWRRLGLDGTPEDQRLPAAGEWGLGPSGTTLEKGDPLFPRIDTA